MAEQIYVMFGCSWTEVSVLGSLVFGQASMESCERKYRDLTRKAQGKCKRNTGKIQGSKGKCRINQE